MVVCDICALIPVVGDCCMASSTWMWFPRTLHLSSSFFCFWTSSQMVCKSTSWTACKNAVQLMCVLLTIYFMASGSLSCTCQMWVVFKVSFTSFTKIATLSAHATCIHTSTPPFLTFFPSFFSSNNVLSNSLSISCSDLLACVIQGHCRMNSALSFVHDSCVPVVRPLNHRSACELAPR